MELQIGDYDIPDECCAKVVGGVVYVFPRAPKGRKKAGRKHCRDCRYFIDGFAVSSGPKTKVCKKRKKRLLTLPCVKDLYFARSGYGEICEDFEEIINKTNID